MEKIIQNTTYAQKAAIFRKLDRQSILVLADFDRTLTMAINRSGQKNSSVALVRESKLMEEEYRCRAQELMGSYQPFEKLVLQTRAEISDYLNRSWQEQLQLMIEYELSREILANIVNEADVLFRPGMAEFIDYLSLNNIPLVVMSAALGDVIELMFKKAKLWRPNIHVIANFFSFDNDGLITGFSGPIINMVNKYETMLADYPVYDLIKERRNVLLIGDSVDDVGMVEGFSYDNLLKIGYLNEPDEIQIEQYKNVFDLVVLNDGDLTEIIRILIN